MILFEIPLSQAITMSATTGHQEIETVIVAMIAMIVGTKLLDLIVVVEKIKCRSRIKQ